MRAPPGPSLSSLKIVSAGAFLPPRVVSAEEIDRRIGRPAGWTLRHTGVASRRFVESETAAEMGAAALRCALAEAPGWRPDLLLGASGTPQQLIPCTAALIAAACGWSGFPCFDVNATCLSFLSALLVSHGLLQSGLYGRIAIVSSEIASKGLNWSEPEAAGLMGDGAAAVLVEAAHDGPAGLLAGAMETWPEGAGLTAIRGGGSLLPAKEHRPGENTADFLFHMDGPAVFRLAAEKMDPFVERLIGAEPGRWEGVDWVIPHQASLPAMEHLRRRLGIPPEKLVQTIREQGNVIAASMPLAFGELAHSGHLQRGQTILFLGSSAGFSLGGALLKY